MIRCLPGLTVKVGAVVHGLAALPSSAQVRVAFGSVENANFAFADFVFFAGFFVIASGGAV